MHGGERDRQGGGFLEIHVGIAGNPEQPAVIGQRIFGERRAARAHHALADLDALGLGTDFGDLAGPFHAEHGADAAGRAMGVALGHAEIGAVQPAGVDADQHLRALRRGLCDVGDFSAVGAVHIGFHFRMVSLRVMERELVLVLFRGLLAAARHHAVEPALDDGFGVADDARHQFGAGRDVVDQSLHLARRPDAFIVIA